MSKSRVQLQFKGSLILIVLLGLLITACDRKESSHADIISADLAIIIDSLGSPCKKVLEYESTGELEYTVKCQSGDRYIISVNPQGRVDLKKHE